MKSENNLEELGMSFSEFRLYKLGDLAEFTQGKQIPIEEQFESCENGMIRFLRIVDYTKKDEPKRYIINPGEKYIVDEEDIIMIRYGSKTAGKVVSGYAGVIANNMFKITVNERLVNKKFLLYLLSNNYVYDMLNASQSSSTMPAITFNLISKLEILLPSLEEQKAIVDILSSLDDKIELNNQMNETLEEMAQALFKRWFVDFEFPNEEGQPYKSSGGEMVESELGMIPKGWNVKSLDQIASFLNGLAMQKFRPNEGEDSLPVLKIKELRQEKVTSDSDRCTVNIDSKYKVNDGDVIFSWSGTLDVRIWCGGEVGLNQHLFKVTSDSYPKWFYYMWVVEYLHQFIRIASDRATTMGHIKRQHLTEAQVLVPSREQLDKMGKVLEPIIEKIIQNKVEKRSLESLRDTVLPKLMSGEIRVSDLC